MDRQRRINDLLELCQNAWVELQHYGKHQTQSNCCNQQVIADLHEGIKQLVQLQDALDEDEKIVEELDWQRKTDAIMEDVRQRLQRALGADSPPSLREGHNNTACFIKPIPVATQSTPFRSTLPKSFPSIEVGIPEEEDSDVSANLSSSKPTQELKPISVQTDEALSSDLPLARLTKGTKGADTYTIPSGFIDPPTRDSSDSSAAPTGFSFARRPPANDDEVLTEKRSRLLSPFFNSLRSSRSTPLPAGPPAQINFYKDEENKNDIFASDAIVDHPLRIGAGCTILSNKGTPITVRKRYSDFVDLRDELLKRYPRLKGSIPKLPPKRVVGKFTPVFVENRRRDLEYFFKYVVLHPTLGTSPVVKQWITQ
ncbi:PX domain-containing protein ypt35 [Apophysomyces ossiformis]|uniref:Endosomal/vacuolar adapter protein YPT35 n=1 Tax=Apophysomyces ossiformis TaxID=679940 RepID=A0A8H7BUI6_9FUNG|nr:PX domain-containing protein ypt35 [Apophysomyces ossiformis]